MKATQEQINRFLAPGKIAIAGVSKNTKKFGYQVFDQLMQKKYEVIPINPNYDEIDGISCFRDVDELPDSIPSLLILTPKNQTDGVLKKALKKKIPNIWIQQFSETKESLQIAKEYEQEIILKKCIFMFAGPIKGLHKFHKNIVQLFGAYPK